MTGIKKLLGSAGFRQVELATHGINPFEILDWMRSRLKRAAPENGGDSARAESFDRVESSYRLNEFLSYTSSRGFLKGMLNSLLNAVRMGDSLKIRAEK